MPINQDYNEKRALAVGDMQIEYWYENPLPSVPGNLSPCAEYRGTVHFWRAENPESPRWVDYTITQEEMTTSAIIRTVEEEIRNYIMTHMNF